MACLITLIVFVDTALQELTKSGSDATQMHVELANFSKIIASSTFWSVLKMVSFNSVAKSVSKGPRNVRRFLLLTIFSSLVP